MRTISVRVVPNAKKAVAKEENGMLRVYVRAPASGNRANSELVAVLAEFFGVKKNCISILKGHKSREKTVSVEGK